MSDLEQEEGTMLNLGIIGRPPEFTTGNNENTLQKFFQAINNNNVDAALECCADNVKCVYPDRGRNWQGKERGRVVMRGIFQLLQNSGQKARYDIKSAVPGHIHTSENWGDGTNRTFRMVYEFNEDNKIVYMETQLITRLS